MNEEQIPMSEEQIPMNEEQKPSSEEVKPLTEGVRPPREVPGWLETAFFNSCLLPCWHAIASIASSSR
jgi:hypothetical protein